MAIPITGKFESAGEFALMDAKDVAMPDGTRLSDYEGMEGKPGQDGKDGTSVTHSWNGTVLTVTSASGTSSADLKGGKGDPGKDGYTPVKGVDYFDGQPGKDGYTPVKGVDYFDGQDGKPGADGKDGSPGKDGADGKTPVAGVDYFTDEEKRALVNEIMVEAAQLLPIMISEEDNGKIMQVVGGAWAAVPVDDSSVANYIEDYIGSALEGDY